MLVNTDTIFQEIITTVDDFIAANNKTPKNIILSLDNLALLREYLFDPEDEHFLDDITILELPQCFLHIEVATDGEGTIKVY